MPVSKRRIVMALVGVAIAISIVIAATGNMHSGRHHPVWVNAVSVLFAVICYGLLIWGLVALVRRLKRDRLQRERG